MNDSMKVFFKITPDPDGYPDIGVESVWSKATDLANEYEIDNIPFFVREATLGDTVNVSNYDGVLWFDKIVRPSRNSLIRIVFFDRNAVKRLSGDLSRLGCQVEYSKDFNLLAVNVPFDVIINEVQDYLQSEQERGVIDYEEPILRG